MKQAELLKSITARCDRIFVIILCRLSNIKLCVQVGKYLQCVGCNVHNRDHCNIHIVQAYKCICANLCSIGGMEASKSRVVTEFPGKREVFFQGRVGGGGTSFPEQRES